MAEGTNDLHYLLGVAGCGGWTLEHLGELRSSIGRGCPLSVALSVRHWDGSDRRIMARLDRLVAVLTPTVALLETQLASEASPDQPAAWADTRTQILQDNNELEYLLGVVSCGAWTLGHVEEVRSLLARGLSLTTALGIKNWDGRDKRIMPRLRELRDVLPRLITALRSRLASEAHEAAAA